MASGVAWWQLLFLFLLTDTDYGCVNGSFESDEEVVKRNLPVMAEYGGTRTYRSAVST